MVDEIERSGGSFFGEGVDKKRGKGAFEEAPIEVEGAMGEMGCVEGCGEEFFELEGGLFEEGEGDGVFGLGGLHDKGGKACDG